MVKIGTKNLVEAKVGTRSISKIYIGKNLVYQKTNQPKIYAYLYKSSTDVVQANLPSDVADLEKLNEIHEFNENGFEIETGKNYCYLYVDSEADLQTYSIQQFYPELGNVWSAVTSSVGYGVKSVTLDDGTTYTYKIFRMGKFRSSVTAKFRVALDQE